MELKELLNKSYAAKILGKGTVSEAEDSFVKELKSDPALKQKAQSTLASISNDMVKRCFISKAHREILLSVIDRANKPEVQNGG